jgi:RNA polymerase sigma factor (sigma-70 family)
MVDPVDSRADRERVTSLHIRQAIANDRDSVAWLISRFTPLLLCQAHQRMAPSLRRFCDPDDVVADVWMAVLPALPGLVPGDGSFSTGLIRLSSTILVRRLRDLLEKHVLGKPGVAPITDASDAGVLDQTRGVVSHVVAEERRGLLWESLSQLAPEDREIIVLHGIEGRPHREVAASVRLSVDTCAARYSRTLRRLRELVPASVLDDLDG